MKQTNAASPAQGDRSTSETREVHTNAAGIEAVSRRNSRKRRRRRDRWPDDWYDLGGGD